MKTKISLLFAAAALVTLSFTFVNLESPSKKVDQNLTNSNNSAPIGGFIADEIIK